MSEQLLDRREFNGLCVKLGLSLPAVSTVSALLSKTSALAAADGSVSNEARRTVKFHDGVIVPALGQGSWHLAQGRHPEAVEEEALRTGLSLGMTLIDTAEIYSDGHSEELISHVIAGRRERVFLVSKVHPNHAAGDGIARACEASLGRLGTDHLDLYLLHWRNRDTDLSGVVAAFESLRAGGKFVPGVCPTSRLATWTISFVSQTAIAARPIRSFTTLVVGALSTICCNGASSAGCR